MKYDSYDFFFPKKTVIHHFARPHAELKVERILGLDWLFYGLRLACRPTTKPIRSRENEIDLNISLEAQNANPT